MTVKGALIATAVAGMFAAALPAVANAKTEGKVKCSGINSCKGKGACGTATNSCSGQNSCKGKGWIEVGEKECKDKKGTVVKGD
jgi:hypothetical protein